MDRVKELGDASVPFPFDVHMMIACDDAPSLENALHKELRLQQLNKTNPRKEFFRTDIETIRELVEANHKAQISYVADPEALQYYQSLETSNEDLDYLESLQSELEDDEDVLIEE